MTCGHRHCSTAKVLAAQQCQPQDAWSISPSSNGRPEARAGQNSLRLRLHCTERKPARPVNFFSGAEEVVVLPRFMEALREAISAFVRSRAVSLRVSGSGVGEGDGDGEGAVFVGAGAGFDVAADGGVGDLVGDFLRTGFSFGFDCSGA